MRWHLKHEQHGTTPWPVQAAYLEAAAGRERFGNHSEQGLGKTSSTLNEFVDFEDVDLNIVLAPSSFAADWTLAPAEWGLGFLRTGMWGKEQQLPFDWEAGVYAIAHETLRGSLRAREALLELFKQRRCMLTFDESTGIKNHNSLLAKYCVGLLVKEAKRVRILNGTPIVQNVLDYYAPLRMLGQISGNAFAFRNRYAKMGGFMGKQIIGMNEDRREELARILNNCSFRALKKDWRKDMPDQIEVPVHLEMTDRQLQHYKTMMTEFYALIGEEEVSADMVLTQRIKLQQISSCLLMKDGKHFWLEEPNNNPKLKAALDLMATGHGKMIVVYFFDPSGRMLIEQFQKAGLDPAWITGGMKPEEIVKQKRRFNDDSSCRVLVGQIDQTSRGHTLLGQKGRDRCYKLFFYETSLSLMHVSQVSDRNHRGEQDETCYLYWPICSPIDQVNVDILTKKKTMAQGMDALVKEVRKFRLD
jgi:hypothetical protein